MSVRRVMLVVAFAVVLGVPWMLRPARSGGRGGDVPTLIVVTPHVLQIREEFGAAFARWHEREHGSPARVDWRTPGGTSEIMVQLRAQFGAALADGRISPDGACEPGAIGFDAMFGGGSFDHGRLKDPKTSQTEVRVGGESVLVGVSMSVPMGFDQARLDEWYGENRVGSERLYDPDQYWLGFAMASFGIVFNRDVFTKLGIAEPRAFEDLARPELAGWIALADPRQSGSITTSLDCILSTLGWERGWRLLRDMSANARYFTNTSTKPPLDVTQGEVAAGLAIDFYGRGQAQAIAGSEPEGASSRVGYVEPAGMTAIDADPISIIRGGPNPELARRFVEFCLSVEGQALWQFPPRHEAASARTASERGVVLGPNRYALRRMPIRRVMYEKYAERFVDRLDPFSIASSTTPRGWRPAIGVMMGAFGIDAGEEQREARGALNAARSAPGFPRDRLEEMERLFYAWPETPMPDGARLAFTEANFAAIREVWRDRGRMAELKTEYTEFFRRNYALVVREWEER